MLVQHLCKNVIEYNAGKPKIPVSISIGYTVNDQKAPNMQHLFSEADNRKFREIFQSEQSGRIRGHEHRRLYRKTISHEDAIEELHHCAGTQFDPE